MYHQSFVVTVIVQLPTDTHVTNPVLSTVAILVLLEDHVTVLSTASAGVTVAVNCSVCHTVDNATSVLFKETPVVCLGASLK